MTYFFLDKREATKTSLGCTLAMVHETLEELDEIRRDGHRSTALMAHCAAADSPDLQHTTSILMRTLETPLKSHEMHVMYSQNSKWNRRKRCEDRDRGSHVVKKKYDRRLISTLDGHKKWPTSMDSEMQRALAKAIPIAL